MSRAVVLNTRAAEQAAALTRLLRLADFDVVEAPAIAIVPSWHPAELERVCRDAFDWVVLPSRNAGHGLETALRALAQRVVCGAATAEVLGLDGARTLTRFSAASALAELQPLVEAGQRVLVPRAAEGRQELVDGLRAMGVSVDAPVAYRTVPVDAARERLRAGGIDVVVLCSPSAVASVAEVVEPVAVVCLGETTAAAAREQGLRVAAVAARTTMVALVEAVERASAVRA